MNEPYRTQFEVRCAFNGFCKKALKYEASSAHRDVKRYQKHFVSFSDLSPEEESQLYTVDKPFESEKDDNSFSVGGKRITPELLADALVREVQNIYRQLYGEMPALMEEQRQMYREYLESNGIRFFQEPHKLTG